MCYFKPVPSRNLRAAARSKIMPKNNQSGGPWGSGPRGPPDLEEFLRGPQPAWFDQFLQWFQDNQEALVAGAVTTLLSTAYWLLGSLRTRFGRPAIASSPQDLGRVFLTPRGRNTFPFIIRVDSLRQPPGLAYCSSRVAWVELIVVLYAIRIRLA